MATTTARLRTTLLIWTAITLLPAWLVTIRGLFEGNDYAWGLTDRIKGRGTTGYYVFAPITASFGLLTLALGWRGTGKPFHLLLAAWHVPLAIAASIAARRNRDVLRLQGDTLNIDISLADIAPAVLGSAAAGAVVLAILERDLPSASPTPPNRRILTVAAAFLPAQLFLLRTGEHHGLADKLGVLLTIGQWGLISVGLGKSGLVEGQEVAASATLSPTARPADQPAQRSLLRRRRGFADCLQPVRHTGNSHRRGSSRSA